MNYNPCYKCTKRYRACQDTCPDGIAAKAEYSARVAYVKKENEKVNDIASINHNNARQRTSGHKSAVDIHMSGGAI